MTAQTWLILLPLVLPFAGVPLTLLFRRNQRLQSAFAVVWMFVTLGFTVALLHTVLTTRQPLVFQMGMWQAPYGITLTADSPAARRASIPPTVIAVAAEVPVPQEDVALVPLFEGREAVDPGTAVAYLCQGGSCRLPTSDPEALARALLESA